MAISNVSSNNRPGVCTFLTRPTAPFNGQVIFETDTRQTLVWQGSAWVMLTDADQPPGLQIITPTGATNGTVTGNGVVVGNAVSSVTVSGVFSADYDSYEIIYSGGQGSTAMQLNFALDGLTTSYYGGFMHVSSAPGGVTVSGVNNASSWTGIGMMRGSSAGGYLHVKLENPFEADQRTRIFCPYFRSDDQSFGTFSGINENTASRTGFVITTSTGTITGGVIRVYGYRK